MNQLPFNIANDIGLIAFAISGVYKGIDRDLDVLGASVLGFMTALGGGVIRDILANRIPRVFIGYSDILFALFGTILAFSIYIVSRKDIRNSLIVNVFDAIGLAAFTVIGSMIGISNHFNMIGILLLGVVTGVGGGLISDILVLRIPMVLSEDFYATCSITGALWMYFSYFLHLGITFATYSSFFIVLFLRIAALIFGWHLPKVKKRPI